MTVNKCGKWAITLDRVFEEKVFKNLSLDPNGIVFVSSAWSQTDALAEECTPEQILRINPGRYEGQEPLACAEGIHRWPLINQGINYESDVIVEAMTIGIEGLHLVILDVDPTEFVCSFDDKLRYVIATAILMHRTGAYQGPLLDREFAGWLCLKLQREPKDTDGNLVWEPEPVPENDEYERRFQAIEGAVMRYDDRLRESFALTFSAVCRLVAQ